MTDIVLSETSLVIFFVENKSSCGFGGKFGAQILQFCC
jgi:hypothetical protein